LEVSIAQLKLIFPDGETEDLAQVADELNMNAAACGLDTPQRLAHFFAQVRQEIGAGMDSLVESLSYSPAALIATYPYYANHRDQAVADGYDRDPVTRRLLRPALEENIANRAMSGRYGNGDFDSGDGWRYRGRGFLQITFRANYAAVTQQCEQIYPQMDVDFVANPDAAAVLPGALRVGVGFWMWKRLNLLADSGTEDADVDRITRVINSGMNGAEDRRANFRIAWNALS
jgi:putative chitinase